MAYAVFASTYQSSYICINLFKNTNLNITFQTTNTIYNLLRNQGKKKKGNIFKVVFTVLSALPAVRPMLDKLEEI